MADIDIIFFMSLEDDMKSLGMDDSDAEEDDDDYIDEKIISGEDSSDNLDKENANKFDLVDCDKLSDSESIDHEFEEDCQNKAAFYRSVTEICTREMAE